MVQNPQENPSEKSSWDDAPLSTLTWIGIVFLFLLALGGVVLNLNKLLRLSRPAEPTTAVPRASSAEIRINSTLILSEESGSFTIWGDPVNRDVICARGEVFDLDYQNFSPDPEELTDLLVTKKFVCADNSGSFEIVVDVDIIETRTTGNWKISSGEGSYQTLSGSGVVEGTYLDEELIADSFTGTVGN
jgi:hypothetical protein